VSTPKHTPGPWTYYHYDSGIESHWRIEDHTGVFVAATSYCTKGKEAEYVKPEAALIAAAPEMLAALEKLIDRLELDSLIPGQGELLELVLMTSKIIKKARGE